MIPSGLKKWLAFGGGIGIEVAGPHGSETLRASAVRVRPTGARLIGQITIENFPHQPAGVWGTEFAAFVKKAGLGHVAATVLLPRQDTIVRQISLPGVSDKDIGNAVQFQLEGLHPYADDDVEWGWARLPGTPSVLVTIVRRAIVERYVSLFGEAGIKVGCFTCSAAAIHSALRLFGPAPAAEILAYEMVLHPSGADEQVEIYGESPSRPLFSASFASDARAGALACAELRLDPATEPQPLERLLAATPALPYAAALVSACPHLALRLNLLPVEQRQSSSRIIWIPTAALSLAVVVLAMALAVLPRYENGRYLRTLQAEIAKVEPSAARAGQIDRQIDVQRRRTLLLDDFRRRTKTDLDVLGEVTRLLPPSAWLGQLDITRTQVVLNGQTDQAAPLLRILDASPLFEFSDFVTPPVHNQLGETFRIRANREVVK